jgi:hypothetical protein
MWLAALWHRDDAPKQDVAWVCCHCPLLVLLMYVTPARWSAFGSKRFNTETDTQYVLSCTPVPDLAVLLFSTAVNASLPAQTSSRSEDQKHAYECRGTGDLAWANSPRGSVQLLNGFAGYNFTESDDLAALMWMRGHLQLMLDLSVSACGDGSSKEHSCSV